MSKIFYVVFWHSVVFCILSFVFLVTGMIIKAVTANASGGLLNGSVELSPTDSALVMQYKDLIRDQDHRLYELEQANESLKHENRMAHKQIEELNNTVAQLRDQNMVLKAHVGNFFILFLCFN